MRLFKRTTMLLIAVMMAMGLNAQQRPAGSTQNQVMATVQSDDWVMVTDALIVVEMHDVGCIVCADTDDTFCVIGNEGTILADRVKRASFSAPGTEVVGIISVDVATEPQLISYVVEEQLTLMGVKSPVTVYSMNGTAVANGKNENGSVVVNVSHLPQGIYIVRAGKQGFKFFKK